MLLPQTELKQDYHASWVIQRGKKTKDDWRSPFEVGEISP